MGPVLTEEEARELIPIVVADIKTKHAKKIHISEDDIRNLLGGDGCKTVDLLSNEQKTFLGQFLRREKTA
ncbi:MAG: hypothetical protein KGH79_03115 [Patescibacteria group bacterium]|nr:hypothetical protein [Patescibacteria group bacterium]